MIEKRLFNKLEEHHRVSIKMNQSQNASPGNGPTVPYSLRPCSCDAGDSGASHFSSHAEESLDQKKSGDASKST